MMMYMMIRLVEMIGKLMMVQIRLVNTPVTLKMVVTLRLFQVSVMCSDLDVQ